MTASHVEAGLARIIGVHAEGVKLRALIAIYLGAVDDLEVLVQEIRTKRLLAGEGEQLDQLGRLVMRGREGLSDALYRVALRCEIRALRSLGTGNDLLDVLALALPDGAEVTLDEVPPATVVIDVADAIDFVPRALARAKAGGVALFVTWSTEPIEASFVLSSLDEDEPDGEAQGFGYGDEDDAPGGLLGTVTAY